MLPSPATIAMCSGTKQQQEDGSEVLCGQAGRICTKRL